MSDTPRTDAELPVYHGFPSTVSREFARTLERELSAQEVQMNAVRYRAEKAERELAAAQSDLARLAQSNAELTAEVERLERLVYVPGLWKCAKCSLTLVSTTFHVPSGGISANKEPQQCANGCGPMWRVTERDAGNDLVDRLCKAEEVARRALSNEEE